MADIKTLPNPFDKSETELLKGAVEQALSSARRQQNMKGRTPQLEAVWKQIETSLIQLQAKINSW